MEGRFLLDESSVHPPTRNCLSAKNVRLPALKAVGKCETDKGRWKTAPERYGNKGAHDGKIF